MELVRDLASHFRTRIHEMRQIGVRDEARMLGDTVVRPPAVLHDRLQCSSPSRSRWRSSRTSAQPVKLSRRGRLKCCLL